MKSLNIFLSETRPRATKFSMLLFLVDLYQVLQILALGSKLAPPRGHKFYIDLGLNSDDSKSLIVLTILPRVAELACTLASSYHCP